ncbi:MAG: flavin reductase family protein [Gammaproteobacteria bacterium]
MARRTFPLSKVCGLLEPGPVVLVTTADNGRRNVMTLSWQTMLDFEPPLLACVVSDRGIDKFAQFGLTPVAASKVSAPLIAECYANLECRVTDTRMVRRYNLFVLQVLQAWMDRTVKDPRTLHHRGYGAFMVAGGNIELRSKMR